MSTVLVAGGTGVLGRQVVTELLRRGHELRVMSRHGAHSAAASGVIAAGVTDLVRGDLASGHGLDAALAGVDVLVHAASNPRRHRRVDVEGTRRLAEAARRADVGHVMYMSIVGVDAIPLGYYRSKLQAERLVEICGVPWTVQRATEFHDFIAWVADLVSRPPVIVVPQNVSVQPVDTGEVALRVADLVDAGPLGRVPDLGGPEVLSARALAEAFLAATGRSRRILEVNPPGPTLRALRDGANLAPGHAEGRRTFGTYLEESIRGGPGPRTLDLPYARRAP